MQNFQPILIAIGILAIVGVLIHGFLLSKKEQESVLPEEYEDLEEEQQTESSEEPYVTMVESDVDAMEFYGIANEEDDEDLDSFDLSLNDEDEIDEDDSEIDDEDSLIDTLLTDKDITDKDSDNIGIDDNETDDYHLDVIASKTDELCENESEVQTVAAKESLNDPEKMSSSSEPQDIFVFNVVARDGSKLGGHELLQFFLTSGFRYGHMNIFHRHENSDGTGEVLFSIANMMAPGTFDLDSMEQFQSQGISFFLTAPNNKIDIKKAFDLMLRAVVQIADEFHCDVLNEQRGTLTETQFIEYRSRLLQYT